MLLVFRDTKNAKCAQIVILIKSYCFLTPHPLRCAQHLFVGCDDISPARGGITSRGRLVPAAKLRVIRGAMWALPLMKMPERACGHYRFFLYFSRHVEGDLFAVFARLHITGQHRNQAAIQQGGIVQKPILHQRRLQIVAHGQRQRHQRLMSDRKSTRLNSSHILISRMPSSA